MIPPDYYLKNKNKMNARMKEWRLCNSEKIKEYREKNKEKAKLEGKIWRDKNKEKIKEDWKLWYKKNKQYKLAQNKKWIKEHAKIRAETRNKYQKARRKTDFKFKLEQNIGNFIKLSIKQQKNGMSWEKLVGYSLDKLIIHLEKQFDQKMNWDNYGSYWHIDHKKPRSWFKYADTDDTEFKKCWSLKNLQPLEAKENNLKGNRYESR